MHRLSLFEKKAGELLVSRQYQRENSRIVIGGSGGVREVAIGGAADPFLTIAGPCAVESREQFLAIATACAAEGANALRGGVFKPRTSPYSFQGMGKDGLALLAEARVVTGLPVITEVMEPGMVESVAEVSDALQIGSRNMQNFPLLVAAGKNRWRRPIVLKRGMSATLEEWLLAAEYILDERKDGPNNHNVILCERGIRGPDSQETRFVLDLGAVARLQELTHLPVIVDPSHATGRSTLVPKMFRAAVAAGAQGVMVEVHTRPDAALSDGPQAILPEELGALCREGRAISAALAAEGAAEDRGRPTE